MIVVVPLRGWVVAATVVIQGEGCATVLAVGTAVAARRGDEDAGLRRVEERHFDDVGEERRGAADREVDHVDAVDHRLVDRRDAVGVEARAEARAVVEADLVGGDAGARRDAADLRG